MTVLRIFVNGKPWDEVARDRAEIPRNSTEIYLYKAPPKSVVRQPTYNSHGPVRSYEEEIAFTRAMSTFNSDYLKGLSAEELRTLAEVEDMI